jgi:hypothetical protein
MNGLGPTPSFDPALIEQLGEATDAMVNNAPRAEIRRWRDKMVTKIRALKKENPGL